MLALLLPLFVCAVSIGAYNVTVLSIDTEPVISYLSGNTAFQQSFNPGFVAASNVRALSPITTTITHIML